ncbi:hypothetical protein AB0G02_09380 [Actinosynnema sp. NPDC023658]|uniref:relaxase/mobilization nuclease domain-containing protein n=1 Tax=Actinosynnema sp. NPDC023658 TaxID=3155465 RepID=UPI0033CB813C
MIAKAPVKGKYGKDTYGLLRYLFGPGRSNEHTDPHLVASWDPEWLAGGAFADRQHGWMARLAREIDAPMTGHELELDGGHVYHVVLSIPRQDGRLGDVRWRELVNEAIERMGFGPREDGSGSCRWVAVHHGLSKDGNDHVHLAVNLVRGDGTVADTYRDWPRWRQWCMEVEQRLGLTRTSPSDKTAAVRSTRAEVEKAARRRLPGTSRDWLRQTVRVAAATAATPAEFVGLLERELLVSVEARWDAQQRLTGYRVALNVDHSTTSPDGRVWFGGSSLAHDLSAPKLMARWAAADMYSSTADPLTNVATAVEAARSQVAAGSPSDDIAHATADVLIAVATTFEGRKSGPLTAAYNAYEWAATTPRHVQPSRWSDIAVGLRGAARDLLKAGLLTRRASTGILVVGLLLVLASLLAEIAAARQRSGHHRQATEAHRAATTVSTYAASLSARQRPEQKTNTSVVGQRRVQSALEPPATRFPHTPQNPTRRTR